MTLQLFFDPACPFCYRGWKDLKAILPDYPGLTIDWQPVEAHPIESARPDLSKWWSSKAAKVSGLRTHSDLSIQGMLYVMSTGSDALAYMERLYDGIFEKGKKAEDAGLLADCAKAAGADAEALGSAIISGEYAQKQRAINDYAYEKCGVWAVPTLRIGDKQLDSVEGVGLSRAQMADFLNKYAK
jgi:predicted DsbA family dithiol-disulfide isomerase